MVTAMDREARRAAFAQAKSESLDALEHPGAMGERKLAQLAATSAAVTKAMPDRVDVVKRVEVIPPQKLTDAETARIEQETRALLTEYRMQSMVDSRVKSRVDSKIAAAFQARAWQDDARRKAMVEFVVDRISKQVAAEITKAHVGGDRAGVVEPLRGSRRG